MFKFVVAMIIISVAVVASAEEDSKATVEKFEYKGVDPDGSYTYSFKTSNSIAQEESGVGGASVAGQASWVAADGTPIDFSYVADENGYRPKGAFIPTIPPAIVKSLEYNAAHPESTETSV